MSESGGLHSARVGEYGEAKRHLDGFAIAHYWFNRTPSLIELSRGEVAEGLHDCDPELVPLREQTRDALARLSAEPRESR